MYGTHALCLPVREWNHRIGLWGFPMPKHTVNLDALIPREYFAAVSTESQHQGTIKELRLSDLDTKSATFSLLRKPDFQRETSYWEASRVTDLVHNFVEGDLIPAIILWRS